MKSFWLILHLLFIIGTVHPQSDDGGDVCNLAECQCVTVGNIFRATCECNSLKHKVRIDHFSSNRSQLIESAGVISTILDLAGDASLLHEFPSSER